MASDHADIERAYFDFILDRESWQYKYRYQPIRATPRGDTREKHWNNKSVNPLRKELPEEIKTPAYKDKFDRFEKAIRLTLWIQHHRDGYR